MNQRNMTFERLAETCKQFFLPMQSSEERNTFWNYNGYPGHCCGKDTTEITSVIHVCVCLFGHRGQVILFLSATQAVS